MLDPPLSDIDFLKMAWAWTTLNQGLLDGPSWRELSDIHTLKNRFLSVMWIHILSKSPCIQWSYGVMAITLDFESNNPSSNLGRTLLFFFWKYDTRNQIKVDEVISLNELVSYILIMDSYFWPHHVTSLVLLLVMTSLQSLPEAPPTSFRHII